MSASKKILIECHQGIGDVIMTFPAINAVKAAYPNSQIDMVVKNNDIANVALMSGLIGECYLLEDLKSSYFNAIKWILNLRGQKYNLAFDFSRSNRNKTVLLLKLCGVKHIVTEKLEDVISHATVEVPVNEKEHRVRQHLKIVEEFLNKKFDTIEKTLVVNREVSAVICKKYGIEIEGNKKIVAVCPGTGKSTYISGKKKVAFEAKNWELEKYIGVIKHLIEKENQVILIGGAMEAEKFKQYNNLEDCGVIDLLGKIPLNETAAVLSVCDLVIGGDTGAMHMAAALGRKTISIFGPTDFNVVGPYGSEGIEISAAIDCRPCYRNNIEKMYLCKERKCLSEISIKDVCDLIDEVINEKK